VYTYCDLLSARVKNIDCDFLSCDFLSVYLRKRPTKDTTDGYGWQCIFGQCPKRLTTKTIRAGSFFERSRLPLAKLVYLMYLWSGETTAKSAADTTGVSQKTIVQLYQYMRDVCSTKLLNTTSDLGGPGVVVQIDESLFNHKSKYQRGRRPDKKHGSSGSPTHPSVTYMQTVAKRDAATLLPIIQKVVRPGSIVYSDEWRAYRQIQPKLGLQHETVNYSVNFVDPSTGVHT
jgi:hypothetical protein